MQVGSSGIARILNLPGHRDCTLPKAVHREKFLPSFFSYQDGLSWHLCTSHCKQSLLSKVSWRAWHCDSPQAARLELDRLIIQDLVEWNQVSMVSDQ